MNTLPFKRPRRGPITADELVRRLESDPVWVAERDRREAVRRAKINENLMAEAPILAELASSGFGVDSVTDFSRRRFTDNDRGAIDILMRWIPLLDNLDIKECIVRALTDKMAKPLAAPLLIHEFRTATGSPEIRLMHYKWAIGQALSVVADDQVFDDIATLAKDKRHGWSRDMLAVALGRMKNPEATKVLIKLLDEDAGQLQREAAVLISSIRALGNRKVIEMKPRLKQFLDHPEPLVRKEARKSLDKIERAEQKAREND